jgi:hypothetical protein
VVVGSSAMEDAPAGRTFYLLAAEQKKSAQP